MPFTTWIRDLLGIRKDFIETEKSVLEIEKLEDEKRERDLVARATLDDVKKYDPKYRRLIEGLRKPSHASGSSELLEYSIVTGLIVALVFLIYLLYRLWLVIFR